MSEAATGRVLLVGAGPGDPELLTLRAARALARADAVVYDALASPSLLALAPGAEHHNVGKRGHEEPTRPQPDVNALLVKLAREGKTVVRLKGGDPLVFGRGGEEASVCAREGIPFEIVPGISSVIGALAYAGIPVTDRRHGASFAVVTGHKDPTRVAAETRWRELGVAVDTLVILMGMRNLASLVEEILAGGRSPETPAAAVMDGTLPSQRVVEAPLAALPERVREAGLGAPAVVVIGDVVRLRSELAWFEEQPLFGARVLVTRSAEQAPAWSEALRRAGAEPVERPLLAARALEAPELDTALAALSDFDALLFTSVNAVHGTAARAGAGLRGFRGPAFCVGPASAAAARAAGLAHVRWPAERHDAEGLAAEVRAYGPVEGKRLLWPRAEAARELLADRLAAAGARVEAIGVYRTEAAAVDAAALRDDLVAGRLDVLSFASPSAVKAFVDCLDDPARVAAAGCIVAAIGPVTAEALSRAGLPPRVVAERAEIDALVEALAPHWRGRPGGGE